MSFSVTLHDIPSFFVSQKVHLRTQKGKYLRAGFWSKFMGVNTTANKPRAWETFLAHRLDDGCITFKSWQGMYLSACPSLCLAFQKNVGEWEKFRVIPVGMNSMYAIQSCHGTYVSVQLTSGKVELKTQVEDGEIFDIVSV